MRKLIEDAQKLPKVELPKYEPLANVRAGKGIAANHGLLDTYQKTLEGYFRMWHHHFEFLLLGYGAYITFFGFCKKAFPEITDQTIARMVAGIEAEIFRPDDELRRLARRAVRAGTWSRNSRTASSANDIIKSLEQAGAPGSEWLERAGGLARPMVQHQRGRRLLSLPPRVERRPVAAVRRPAQYMRQVRAGETLEREVTQLQAERKQLIDDYRELLTTDEERAAYDQMITLAHRVFPYVEGHKFYCEHWYTNLFFNKIREFGAPAVAEQASSRDAEDVFHLTHYELKNAIIDMMTAWSNGSPPRGPKHWPKIVAERKAAIATWAKHGHAAGPRAGAGRHR